MVVSFTAQVVETRTSIPGRFCRPATQIMAESSVAVRVAGTPISWGVRKLPRSPVRGCGGPPGGDSDEGGFGVQRICPDRSSGRPSIARSAPRISSHDRKFPPLRPPTWRLSPT